MARLLGIGLLALVFVVLPGCGGGAPKGTGIKIKGTIVKHGKPLQPAPTEDDSVDIQLLPPDSKSDVGETVARYNHAEGAFEINGPLDAGVVPGEYRIVLNYIPYVGEGNDVFGEQFTRENTPLKYTVTNDKEQEIVIDVGKKTVTKVR